jgi:hypothetical protein
MPDTDRDVLGGDAGPGVLNDDHGPTDSPAVARDVDGTVVVVDINAHELAELARAPELAEVRDEARGVARQADDRPVHVHDERVRAVDLRARRERDV